MNDQRAHMLWLAKVTTADVRACNGKIRYPSKKVAAAAARTLPMRPEDDERCPAHAYKCPLCHRWHVGHSRVWTKYPPKRRRQGLRATLVVDKVSTT